MVNRMLTLIGNNPGLRVNRRTRCIYRIVGNANTSISPLFYRNVILSQRVVRRRMWTLFGSNTHEVYSLWGNLVCRSATVFDNSEGLVVVMIALSGAFRWSLIVKHNCGSDQNQRPSRWSSIVCDRITAKTEWWIHRLFLNRKQKQKI